MFTRKELAQAWRTLAELLEDSVVPGFSAHYLCWFTDDVHKMIGSVFSRQTKFRELTSPEVREAMTARIQLDLGGYAIAFNGQDDDAPVLASSDEGRDLRVLACLFFAEEAEAGSLKEQLEQVVNQLAAVGNADAIAAFLEEQGIKGARSAAFRCPVANYVKRELGVERVTAYESIYAGEPNTVEVRTPPSVFAFIEGFDNRQYPKLIGK